MVATGSFTPPATFVARKQRTANKNLRHREAGFCHFVPEYMAKGIWVKLFKGSLRQWKMETWEDNLKCG